MEKLLLKLPEAGERLGLGRSKLYELIQEGVLPVVRIGRSVRVPASELERFVQRLQEAEADGQ